MAFRVFAPTVGAWSTFYIRLAELPEPHEDPCPCSPSCKMRAAPCTSWWPRCWSAAPCPWPNGETRLRSLAMQSWSTSPCLLQVPSMRWCCVKSCVLWLVHFRSAGFFSHHSRIATLLRISQAITSCSSSCCPCFRALAIMAA